MLAECPGYRSSKRSKGNSGRTQVDTEDKWDRFIGIMANELEMIRKYLLHLKAVSIHWGREKLQHYNWPTRGWSFYKKLGPIANKIAWPEFIIKANQLLARRALSQSRSRVRNGNERIRPRDIQPFRSGPVHPLFHILQRLTGQNCVPLRGLDFGRRELPLPVFRSRICRYIAPPSRRLQRVGPDPRCRLPPKRSGCCPLYILVMYVSRRACNRTNADSSRR